ncbi:MAG: glycerophosphodiester phosphodiesterase [Bacteroidetes bacterium]|nr:glycerophosphodiester phosphodiesterase [Bacteroidota bacterium]
MKNLRWKSHSRVLFNFPVAAGIVVIIGVLIVSGLINESSRGKSLVQALGIPRLAVIAHRGASYLAPEETRPAFLMARELGADYLEFDIQRTKDGVLIALHDDDLSRTTNVAEVFPGREKDTIDNFTFAELQQLDAGSWFNRQNPDRARDSFKGLGILRLEDIIQIVESGSNRPGIYIETKAAQRFPGIERQLVETLAAHGWINGRKSQVPIRLIFQSFELDSLARLKELAPDIPRLLLVDEVMTSRVGWEGVLQQATEVGEGIGTWGYHWAYGSHWSLKDTPTRHIMTWPWYTREAHRAGLFVHAWTIDDRWEMWLVRVGGADGIFTNRAELALATYGRASSDDLNSLWNKIGY